MAISVAHCSADLGSAQHSTLYAPTSPSQPNGSVAVRLLHPAITGYKQLVRLTVGHTIFFLIMTARGNRAPHPQAPALLHALHAHSLAAVSGRQVCRPAQPGHITSPAASLSARPRLLGILGQHPHALHHRRTGGAGGQDDGTRTGALTHWGIAVRRGRNPATLWDGCRVELGQRGAQQGRVPVPHSTAPITLGGLPQGGVGVTGMGPGLTW